MIEDVIPWIGTLAATLTSLSYLPQLRKAWPRGSTSDLSLKTLTILTLGLLLWLTYGVMKQDRVIIIANGIGAALSAIVLVFKMRDIWWKEGAANGQ